MAKLDRKSRMLILNELKLRLPAHWAVTDGRDDHIFVEADQDGRRPDWEFPTIGSTVMEARNNADSGITVIAYRRIKCPPGMVEARKVSAIVCEEAGLGWRDRLVEAMVQHAAQADRRMQGAS